ncbi:unnamed protein product, partial [Darwinula stevensoni]
GFALCLWSLVVEETSGIYIELVFLDVALNFGQGFFAFVIFGLDARLIVAPFIKRWRKLWYGSETLKLPPYEDLPAETRTTCEQFVKYHLEKCSKDIVRDRRFRQREYTSVFLGNELVDWLVIVGLAPDRSQAVKYGRMLVRGRVIRHIESLHHFHDQPYHYEFLPLSCRPHSSL